jgi:hypothetical protein
MREGPLEIGIGELPSFAEDAAATEQAEEAEDRLTTCMAGRANFRG